MRTTAILETRFSELEQQANEIESTKRYERSDWGSGERIDSNLLLNWRVKARHLLVVACGIKSEHYKQFVETEVPQPYRTSYEEFRSLLSIFSAAAEDFRGGYIISVKSLVQAELFSDELDQASALLGAGYIMAAAVIAGTVLETSLRQICIKNGLAVGKMDKMNADLAKAGVYNLLVQKRITAIADIRNNAAHGNSDQFQRADVVDMISYIESFLSERLF